MAYETLILEVMTDSEESHEARVNDQMRRGVSRRDAELFSRAGTKATREAATAIMRVVDEHGDRHPVLQQNVLLYVMRMVVSNMDKLEELVNMMVIASALEHGIPIATDEATPGCDCPSCQAARTQGAQTRH